MLAEEAFVVPELDIACAGEGARKRNGCCVAAQNNVAVRDVDIALKRDMRAAAEDHCDSEYAAAVFGDKVFYGNVGGIGLDRAAHGIEPGSVGRYQLVAVKFAALNNKGTVFYGNRALHADVVHDSAAVALRNGDLVVFKRTVARGKAAAAHADRAALHLADGGVILVVGHIVAGESAALRGNGTAALREDRAADGQCVVLIL